MFRKVYAIEVVHHFVWVGGLKMRLDSVVPKFYFKGSGHCYNFITDSFRDSSVDKVGFENCYLRLVDGFDFEDVCRNFVRLALFMRCFEIE